MPDTYTAPFSLPEAYALEKRIASLLHAGEPVALLTVVQQEGMLPETGSHVLLARQGVEGSFGGGSFEEEVLLQAQQFVRQGLSGLISVELATTTALVLCEYLGPDQAEMFALAASIKEESGQAIWLVDLRDEEAPHRALCIEKLPRQYQSVQQEDISSLSLHADEMEPSAPAELPDGVSTDYATGSGYLEKRKGKAGILAPNIPLYVEALRIPPVLLLCGGGQLAQETARLASAAGFLVDVVDDEEAYANPQRFPDARQCFALPDYEQIVENCAIGRQHYIAIITRNQESDLSLLAQILASHAHYIGILGTREKREQLCTHLRAEGVPDAELACIRCPIGLPIGAETIQQTAIAIVAELLAARAGTLQRLRIDDN